jgi:hypothetical protein
VRICHVPAIHNFFAQLQNTYWDHHYTLTSKRAETAMALVGESRVNDMLANVFFPSAITSNPKLLDQYRQMPALDASKRVEAVAKRLFGSNPRWKKAIKTIVFQQGVLQVYDDFCGRDNGNCSECELQCRLADAV